MTSVLQLGEPALRAVSRPVESVAAPEFRAQADDLEATLASFRAKHGFGRAIAAPQIGVPLRFIALELGRGPELVINPEITWRSADTFTLWDDCMSFPSLLVKVRRHESISIEFLDRHGERCAWERLPRDVSELLQHETDHLDGVLAIDHAVDRESIVAREVFERRREEFLRQVDGGAAN